MSIFPNAPATGGAGLFGASQTAPTSTTGGGLFGTQPQGQQGGLFGKSNAPTTGLFGQTPATNPTSTTTGGLFGNIHILSNKKIISKAGNNNAGGTKPPTTGGLFGQSNTGGTQAPVPGGIFGNTTTTTAANNTATTTTPATGNLFNGGQQPAGNVGGLFNNKVNTNPQQPQQQQQNTTGNTGLFQQNTQNLQGNTNPSTINATATGATNVTQNLLNPTTQQQQQDQNKGNNPPPRTVTDVSLTNEKLNPLVQKWKRKVQAQSENVLQTYASFGESIQQVEECYKYYNNIASISQGLNGQFEQINIEVKNIQVYQEEIEKHLDIIRSKLSKQLELQGDSQANAFKNPIGDKIQGIDFDLTQIEKNVNQIIDEINPQKDQTQDSKNTINSSLNSYYDILNKLEQDTIHLQFKLQQVADKVTDQY